MSASTINRARRAMPGRPCRARRPLTGLPPSETALVWLTKHRSAKVRAFADAATTVIDNHDSL